MSISKKSTKIPAKISTKIPTIFQNKDQISIFQQNFKKQRDDSLCPSESWSMLWSVSTCATIVTSTHHHGIPGKDYKSLHPMVNPSLYLTNIHTINIHWQSFTILLFEPFPQTLPPSQSVSQTYGDPLGFSLKTSLTLAKTRTSSPTPNHIFNNLISPLPIPPPYQSFKIQNNFQKNQW